MHETRWIFFDAADTLLRPEPSVANTYCSIALEHGIETTVETVKRRFAAGRLIYFCDERSSEQLDRERWQSLVLDVLQTDRIEVFDHLWDHFAKPTSWRLYEDVEPTWNALLEGGFQLGIASNFDARLLPIVKSLPPINAAKHVFYSSNIGFRKPSTMFFRAIEESLGIQNTDATLVGDSQSADFEGAKQAGWNSIHLKRGEANPTWPVISTLSDLQSIKP